MIFALFAIFELIKFQHFKRRFEVLLVHLEIVHPGKTAGSRQSQKSAMVKFVSQHVRALIVFLLLCRLLHLYIYITDSM